MWESNTKADDSAKPTAFAPRVACSSGTAVACSAFFDALGPPGLPTERGTARFTVIATPLRAVLTLPTPQMKRHIARRNGVTALVVLVLLGVLASFAKALSAIGG
jgi:hypothetical protein